MKKKLQKKKLQKKLAVMLAVILGVSTELPNLVWAAGTDDAANKVTDQSQIMGEGFETDVERIGDGELSFEEGSEDYEKEESNGGIQQEIESQVSSEEQGEQQEVYTGEKLPEDVQLDIDSDSIQLFSVETSLNVSLSDDQKEAVIQTGPMEKIDDGEQIRFAVWSDEHGQDDLRWYTAEYLSGAYSQRFRIADFKNLGKYTIHCYAFDKNGTAAYVGGTGFTADLPAMRALTVGTVDADTGEFPITLQDITSKSGIAQVRVGVWCAENQSDMWWYDAKQSGTQYVVNANVSNHKFHSGNYKVHVYVTDGNGFMTFVGGAVKSIQIASNKLYVQDVDNTQRQFRIMLANPSGQENITNVRFAVWSNAGGQDDLKWYTADYANGLYSKTISIADFKRTGTYTIHTYATKKNGEAEYIMGKTFRVDTPSLAGMLVENTDTGFSVQMQNLKSHSGIERVEVGIWSSSNQSDLCWYTAEKNADNYTVYADIAKHKNHIGTYNIHVYAVDGNGIKSFCGAVTKTLAFSCESLQVKNADDISIYQIELEGLRSWGLSNRIQFAVWNKEGGQDDLRWYEAEKQGDKYLTAFDIDNHGWYGDYTVHAYALDTEGKKHYVSGKDFTIEQAEKTTVKLDQVNGKTGTFRITAVLGKLGYTAKSLRVGVWSTGVPYWYELKKSENNIYQVSADIKNHQYQFGTYNAHVYAEDESGNLSYVGGASVTLNADNYVLLEQPGSDSCKITIYGPNVKGQAVSSVKFPTWTTQGQQDDLVWYEGKRNEDGSYTAVINRNSHKRSGAYTTHIYGYLQGTAYMLGGYEYSLYHTGEFDDHAKAVMHNIIYAVETGGQVYGNAQYNDFTEAYTNSTKETAITIGAGAWFATEAKRLLNLIREADPKLFASLDTAGIGEDLDKEDWTTYGGDGNGKAVIRKGSAKAVCIQKIISTDIGKKTQDTLVDQQMTEYVNRAEKLGVTDLKARMFCANVHHLGGYGAMTWAIQCCKDDGKALTMPNIWQSMRDHTPNKSGNGVGADKYVTRHQKVMGWLDRYIV